MGYRSEVGIALRFASPDMCEAFITAYKLKEPEFWTQEVGGCWRRASTTVLTTHYEDVKWSRAYEDVNNVYDMLDFAEENFESAWLLIRIGEDVDDIEFENGSGDAENYPVEIVDRLHDYLSVRRSIDIDLRGVPI